MRTRALLLLLALALPSAALAQSNAACGCTCGLWLDPPCGPCDCIRACKMDLCDPRAKEQGCGGCDGKEAAATSGGAASSPDLSRLPLGDQLMFHAADQLSKGIAKGLQDMPANVGRQAEVNAENARALNEAQSREGQAAEQYLQGKAQREQAEKEARRKQLEGDLLAPAARASAAATPAPPPRVGAAAPLMPVGPPRLACGAGKPRSLQCLDSEGDAPPPPFTGRDAAEAEAVRVRFQDELDADRRDEAVELMQARLTGYVKSEYFSEAKDKIRDFVLGKDESGRPMRLMETVSEGKKIVSSYAGKVTAAFQGEASAVPCLMASGPGNTCSDAFSEHAEKLDEGTREMKRETYLLTAKSFGAEKAIDHAKHELGHEGAGALYELIK